MQSVMKDAPGFSSCDAKLCRICAVAHHFCRAEPQQRDDECLSLHSIISHSCICHHSASLASLHTLQPLTIAACSSFLWCPVTGSSDLLERTTRDTVDDQITRSKTSGEHTTWISWNSRLEGPITLDLAVHCLLQLAALLGRSAARQSHLRHQVASATTKTI